MAQYYFEYIFIVHRSEENSKNRGKYILANIVLEGIFFSAILGQTQSTDIASLSLPRAATPDTAVVRRWLGGLITS